MAALNPPSVLNQGQYSARLDRLTMGALWTPGAAGGLASRPGVRPSSGSTALKVTPGAGLRVNVAVGTAVVAAPATNGGVYECHNDASFSVTLGASDPALNRIDLIVARVYDAEYSGTDREWHLEPVPGTPSATPSPKPVPPGSLLLAQARVNAGATSITTDDIDDMRVWTVSVGGILPIADGNSYPANPFPGFGVFRLDRRQAEWWSGDDWTYGDDIKERLKAIEARQERAILELEGSGDDNSIAPDSTEFNTTFHTSRNIGGFGNGEWSAEKIIPRDGVYLVLYRSQLRRRERTQREDAAIRVRLNGTPGEPNGSTTALARASFGESGNAPTDMRLALTIAEVGGLSAGTRIKFLVSNFTTSGRVVSEGNPDSKDAALVYLGPR